MEIIKIFKNLFSGFIEPAQVTTRRRSERIEGIRIKKENVTPFDTILREFIEKNNLYPFERLETAIQRLKPSVILHNIPIKFETDEDVSVKLEVKEETPKKKLKTSKKEPKQTKLKLKIPKLKVKIPKKKKKPKKEIQEPNKGPNTSKK